MKKAEEIRLILESYMERNGDSLSQEDVSQIGEVLNLLDEFSREKIPKDSIGQQIMVAMVVQIISEIIGNVLR